MDSDCLGVIYEPQIARRAKKWLLAAMAVCWPATIMIAATEGPNWAYYIGLCVTICVCTLIIAPHINMWSGEMRSFPSGARRTSSNVR
jgi:hypothetical protein